MRLCRRLDCNCPSWKNCTTATELNYYGALTKLWAANWHDGCSALTKSIDRASSCADSAFKTTTSSHHLKPSSPLSSVSSRVNACIFAWRILALMRFFRRPSAPSNIPLTSNNSCAQRVYLYDVLCEWQQITTDMRRRRRAIGVREGTRQWRRWASQSVRFARAG